MAITDFPMAKIYSTPTVQLATKLLAKVFRVLSLH
jgi:hypothetical protein